MNDNHVRKRHVSLPTQQHRLRHMRGICARNISSRNFPPEFKENFALNFTVHLVPSGKKIYTSEYRENSLNPNWSHFEISQLPEDVPTSAKAIQVKIWCCNKKTSSCDTPSLLIIDWIVNFSGLYYIGEQVPKDGKRFFQDSVVFHMLEGHYGCNNCLISPRKSMDGYVIVETNNLAPSYNLSSIQRIHTVQRAIKQTKVAVRQEWEQMKSKLINIKRRKQLQANMELIKLRMRLLCDEVRKQEQRFKNMQESLQNTECCQRNQSIELESKFKMMGKYKDELSSRQDLVNAKRLNFFRTSLQVALRCSELISELYSVYPIKKISDEEFRICDVILPNSEDFAGHQDQTISIALGYVAHLVLMISRLIDVPIRYPIKQYSSRSTIFDHITDKISDKEREFPLYCKGKDKIPFHYGVYLLNKNIAQLRHHSGLSTSDARATLQNLSDFLEHRTSTNPERFLISEHFLEKIVSTFSKSQSVQKETSTTNGSQNADMNKNNTTKLSALTNYEDSVDGTLTSYSNGQPHSSTPVPITNNVIISMSLDQGLNNIRMSASPLPTKNIDDVQRLRQISQSQVEIASLSGDAQLQHGFYKASVNMWKNANSSDDELSDVQRGSRRSHSFNNNGGCNPKEEGRICQNCDDGVNCDIVNRVEILATRSGSFKQLLPSRKS